MVGGLHGVDFDSISKEIEVSAKLL